LDRESAKEEPCRQRALRGGADDVVHGRDQRVFIERLVERGDADGQAVAEGALTVTSDENDWEPESYRNHPLTQLEAVQPRQTDVENEAVNFGTMGNELLCGCKQTNIMT